MKTSISRESDQIYLTLEDIHVQEESYSLKMIRSCPIGSLLPCSIFFFNGEYRLRFNITGLTSLSERFASRPVRYGEIREVLFTLRDICIKLPDYLLDSEELLLDPDDIFMSPGDNRVKICYVPGLMSSQPESRKLLAEYLLKHTDHSDQAATDLAYAFYDRASDENCILSGSLQEILTRQTDTKSSSLHEQEQTEQVQDFSPAYTVPQSSADDFSIFDTSPASKRADPSDSEKYAAHPDHIRNSKSSGDASVRPRPRIPRALRRKQEHDRKLLILLIIAAVASGGCAAFYFQMDAAQIGGFAFLSAAVIWLVRQQQYKKSGDLQNIWSDEEEDMVDDDTFYRSLLDEVYSDDSGSIQHSPLKSDGNGTMEKSQPPQPASAPQHELLSLQPEVYNNIPLNRSVIVIGKNPHDCDICLRSDTISRVHAKIEKIGEDYYLTDLFSTNGTFLDGQRIEPNHAVLIPHGAEVSFARYHYRSP